MDIRVVEVTRTRDGALTVWQVGPTRHQCTVTVESHAHGVRAYHFDNENIQTLCVFFDVIRPFGAAFFPWFDGCGHDVPWVLCDFSPDDLPERYRGPFVGSQTTDR